MCPIQVKKVHASQTAKNIHYDMPFICNSMIQTPSHNEVQQV